MTDGILRFIRVAVHICGHGVVILDPLHKLTQPSISLGIPKVIIIKWLFLPFSSNNLFPHLACKKNPLNFAPSFPEMVIMTFLFSFSSAFNSYGGSSVLAGLPWAPSEGVMESQVEEGAPPGKAQIECQSWAATTNVRRTLCILTVKMKKK